MKAQTATEMILMLSTMLVVAVIASTLLLDFPFDTASAREKAARSYWSAADIAFVSYDINATHAIFIMQNNLRDAVRLTNIGFNDERISNNSIRLDPGSQVFISVPFDDGLIPGESYSYDVVLNVTYYANNQLNTIYGKQPIIGVRAS